MIRTIKIKAFKSLLDVEVELGKINVFIGANGSGKSNLLEAIGVLGAAANGRVDDEALLRRGVRPGVPALYKSSFRGQRARKSIRLEATSAQAQFSVELNNPLENPEPAWTFSHETWDEGEEHIVGRSPATRLPLDPQRGLAALRAVERSPESPASLLLQKLASYRIFSPDTATLRGLRTDSQQGLPVGLAGGRLAEAVTEVLQARRQPELQAVASEVMALIDWASNYGEKEASALLPLSPSVASPKKVLFFEDRFMAEGRNALTAYDASEGALVLLFAAVLARSPDAPPFLAIDNADHGLNPRLARALMEKLCAWVLASPVEKQLLLTTHNPLVLDGLPLQDDEVRLFAVGRSRKGLTTVSRVRLSPADLEKSGEIWTVSRLWIAGHLGGVPDV